MVRRGCAWMLLLLAASPVTAPFSTCDLRALLNTTSVAQTFSLGQVVSASVTAPLGNDDAYSVSPIETTTSLPKQPAARMLELPFALTLPPVSDTSYVPCQQNSDPHDPPLRALVLRV